MAGIFFPPNTTSYDFRENLSGQQTILPVSFQSYDPYPFDYLYPTVDPTTSFPKVVSVTIGGADADKFSLYNEPYFWSYTSRLVREGPSYSTWHVVLVQNGPFDFEAPTDANKDNSYELSITVTDNAGNIGVSNLHIVSVIDVIEGVPIPSSPPPSSPGSITGPVGIGNTVDPPTEGGDNYDIISGQNEWGGLTYEISLGTSGRWLSHKKVGRSDMIWKSRLIRGRKRGSKSPNDYKYLIDNDYQVINGFDPNKDALAFPGNLQDYQVNSAAGGVRSVYTIGNNVVASIDVPYSIVESQGIYLA